MTLLHEIRRRRVVQATLVYVVVAAMVAAVSALVVAILGASPWITRIVIVLGLMILPFAIWLAWTYDLKEQGVERTGQDPQTSQMALPWHRIAFPVTVSALALTGSLAFFSLNSHASEVDGGLVAVLPFRVNGSSDIEYLRNGMVEVLSAELNRGEQPHAADPATVIVAYEKISGSHTVLPRADAEKVAREVGAGQLLTGSVVGNSEQLTVTATLVALATGQTVSGSVQTAVGGLPQATSALIAQLFEAQKKTR
jgi:TolB-like protein